MTAGIVSYQLCDRDFDCDHCPLDAAIRRQYHPERELLHKSKVDFQKTPSGGKMREGCLYSEQHCWVCPRAETLVRVGIEPGLASALVSPKSVAFPAVGEHIRKGQVCLWVITTGGTFPITAPVNGRVWAVNSLLNEVPHTIVQQPYEQGWLFDLTVTKEEVRDSSLMSGGQAEKPFAQDDARFRSLLSRALARGNTNVGTTMADGGEPLEHVADMLGPKKYFTILCEVYG
jgi:glycine cleavage system H protein